MPKDLIHFTVAERTAALLANTRYASYIINEMDGLLLGSVFHDSLFYAVTSGGKPLERLADNIHGADGQDTYFLIKSQVQHIQNAANKALPTALLVGMISHLFADVVMHPMVWHFTGDYYSNDPLAKTLNRQRHRALESLMDMVACPDKLGNEKYNLRTLLQRCPPLLSHGIPVSKIAAAAHMQVADAQKELARAWKIFSSFQSAFSNQFMARILFALRPKLPRFFAEISTLFYAPQLVNQAYFIQQEIQYSHPVTGEVMVTTLDSLIEDAAKQASQLCKQLEEAVFSNKPFPIKDSGPSLDAGMIGVPTSSMIHFATPPFPSLD